MRAGLLAVAALMAGAEHAAAAGPSFDCARAKTPHERLICADPTLAKADADLADVYRSALDRLGPDGRAVLAASQRGWVTFSREVCPLPYPEENRGVSLDAAGCLLGEYRERTAALRGGVRQVGAFTVVRLDAYSVRRLGPDDPGGHYPGGLAAGEVSADWIEPSSLAGDGAAEAARLDAALMPSGLRAGGPRFTVEPKPVLDTDSMDTDLAVTIETVTPLIVTTRTVDWSHGHGTPHGWGYTTYGARWRSDARRISAEDLFAPGGPWRALIEARVSAETQPFSPWTWAETGAANHDVDLRPDGLVVNAGYVDGYGGGQKVVVVPWADLKPYLGEQGRRIVGSLTP